MHAFTVLNGNTLHAFTVLNENTLHAFTVLNDAHPDSIVVRTHTSCDQGTTPVRTTAAHSPHRTHTCIEYNTRSHIKPQTRNTHL